MGKGAGGCGAATPRGSLPEPSWSADPDIADWQQGLCDTYAKALLDCYPHLRLGLLLNGDEVEQHYFAHDDAYAYDSLGRHPLPYTGLRGDLACSLDEDPGNYGIGSHYPHGENGGPEDYRRARSLIPGQHPWLGPPAQPKRLSLEGVQADAAVRARNERRFELDKHADVCLLCGRPLTQAALDKGAWAHVDTSGWAVAAGVRLREADNQGWFPVGPECARKLGSFALRGDPPALAA